MTVLFLFGLSSFLWLAPDVCARFYKYVDENGVAHFVDAPHKIPEQYNDQAQSYEERTDRLSPEEIQKLAEKRRKAEQERARREELEKQQRERERIERRKREFLKNLENYLKGMADGTNAGGSANRAVESGESETPVTIRGNTVFVPVIIGYDRNEIQADLVLDTGANIVTLHKDVAVPLRIHEYERTKAKVVGGSTISAKLVQLSYVKVGPHTQRSVHALIIDNESTRTGYDGLLGANFLLKYQYSIDYKRSVIQWW